MSWPFANSMPVRRYLSSSFSIDLTLLQVNFSNPQEKATWKTQFKQSFKQQKQNVKKYKSRKDTVHPDSVDSDDDSDDSDVVSIIDYCPYSMDETILIGHDERSARASQS
jgi:hypothetical protein